MLYINLSSNKINICGDKLIVKTTYNLIGRIISKLVSMEMEIFIFVGYCLTLFDLQSQHRSLKLPFYMFYFIQA